MGASDQESLLSMAHRSDMAADQELQQDSEQFDVGRDTGQLMEHDQVSGAVSSLCSEDCLVVL